MLNIYRQLKVQGRIMFIFWLYPSHISPSPAVGYFCYVSTKYCYTQELKNWQRNKPNKIVELQDIAQIFANAYLRAATIWKWKVALEKVTFIPITVIYLQNSSAHTTFRKRTC